MNKLLQKIVLRWLSNSWIVSPIKVKIWRIIGIEIGANTKIGFHVYFDNSRIRIGNNCLINVGTTIICGAGENIPKISIGNNVQIGPNCTILGLTHSIGDMGGEQGKLFIRVPSLKMGVG